MKLKNKNWALVLSGGGAKGIAHVGALRGLEKLGLKPDLIVGASMGAIIGGLYCSGMTIDDMIDVLENQFELKDHMDLPHMEHPDTRLWKLLHDIETCRLMGERYGLDKQDSVLDFFRELTGDRLLENTDIPLVINAVDLLSSRQVELDSGSIATAMRASMAIPGVFTPVLQDDMVLVDGGILDNMPVAIARRRGFETVVALNVGKPVLPQHLGSAMSILATAVWTAGRKPDRTGNDKPTMEIKIDVEVQEQDFGSVMPYVEAGEQAVFDTLPKINDDFYR